MSDQRIIRSPGQGYRRLGLHGQAVIGSHMQITSILRNRLGREHAAFLARPEVDPDSGDVDWYTSTVGSLHKFTDLPETERVRLQNLAEQLKREIRQLADKLKREGDSAGLIGGLLEQAMETPLGDWLYECQGMPLLVMWGHSDEQQTLDSNIQISSRPLPPAKTALPLELTNTTTTIPTNWWSFGSLLPWVVGALKFLLWLLVTFLLFWLLLSGLSSCVPNLQPPSYGAPTSGSALAAAQSRERALQLELDEMRRKAAMCTADTTNVLKVDEELRLTDSVLKSGKLDFLKGEWRNTSKMTMNDHSSAAAVTYRFAADGSGEVVAKNEETVCRAPIKARIEASKLFWDTEGTLQCENGTLIQPQHVECSLSSKGKTHCEGVNLRSGDKYPMSLKRIH